MDEMEEIVGEFLVESHENLDLLDSDLVALEQDPASRALLGSIFRTIHTIKGTSGFLGYSHLEAVTHVGENLLSKLRDGELALTPAITSTLLDTVDAVRGLLGAIEATGEEGSPDHSALIGRLTEALDPSALQADAAAAPATAMPAVQIPAPAPAPAVESSAAEPALTGAGADSSTAAAAAAAAPPTRSKPRAPRKAKAAPAPPDAEDGVAPRATAGEVSADDITLAALEQQLSGHDRRIGEVAVEQGPTGKPEVTEALESQTGTRRAAADSSIRVDVDLLDSLMRLVGELVLTRNQIVQHASADINLARASQRLNLIASELQEGVMKTRMQPIDHVWSKLTRVVRDLGLSCGKSVRLEMEGRETELDRTILEAVKDPLTHLVRNAIDHGIESPAQRTAAGKPEQGVLLLRAFHAGGQVNIEIIDDGAGIDPAKVAAKGMERGLITADDAVRMSEREIISLIFQAGFSTAATVSNVSGRGVGMDVVKTNIEAIGGTVDISSKLGHGSTFRIKIPLTLAIIPALTVRCAGDRYAIPQVSLVELVRLEGDGEGAGKGIEQLSGAPVLRLRGNLLPLVHLREELGVTGPDPLSHPDQVIGIDAAQISESAGKAATSGQKGTDGPDRPGRAATFIVVLQAEDRQFGLVVDEVLDTEEIVVKPLGTQLKGLAGYAGATILGDGRVALILDALALAQQANVLNASRSRAVTERQSALDDARAVAEPLLVVALDDGRRMAIPLAMVTRLEEFALTEVERVGSRQVVQYRGEILPLVGLASYLGAGTYGEDSEASLQVVVYSEAGRSVGLIVAKILDIAEEVLTTTSDLDDHGLLGSAVVQNKITEMLDVHQAILGADPHFYDSRDHAAAASDELIYGAMA